MADMEAVITERTDQKWLSAISSVSRRVETAGSGHVTIYNNADGSVDAEATLRHFLEVTCNIRVQPDHSAHKVPTGPPAGSDKKPGGVSEVNQPAAPSATKPVEKAKSAK